MSPKEAIQEYIAALDAVGAELSEYQFEIANGRIRMGYVVGPSALDVQWGMRSFTPEEFVKMAEMRRMNLKIGDPRRPH
jgi:hypothetical protein